MIVHVSDRTYHAALDPAVTGVPTEIGLPRPIMKKVGKGHQFVYDLSKCSNPDVLYDMVTHLDTIAEELPGRTDRRKAIMEDVARITRTAK